MGDEYKLEEILNHLKKKNITSQKRNDLAKKLLNILKYMTITIVNIEGVYSDRENIIDDVVQNIIVKLEKKKYTINAEKGKVRSYIKRMIVNEVRTQKRNIMREISSSDNGDGGFQQISLIHPIDIIIGKELKEMIQVEIEKCIEFLSGITKKKRAVLFAKVLGKGKLPKGISEENAWQIVSRIRREVINLCSIVKDKIQYKKDEKNFFKYILRIMEERDV